jgi:synapsin
MRLKEEGDFEDFVSCLNIHNDYFFVEPFMDIAFDLRLQKIGKHYRVYSRQSDSSWKQNWGKLKFADHELTEKYKLWMDEVSLINGGLGKFYHELNPDMFALDVMRLKDGTDVVLEVNDTAMGLMYDHIDEDCGYILELTIEKMDECFQ